MGEDESLDLYDSEQGVMIYKPRGQGEFIARFYSASETDPSNAFQEAKHGDFWDEITFSYASSAQYDRATQLIAETVARLNGGEKLEDYNLEEVIETELSKID